jgi:Flp pilus assembly pilin Flp
MRNTTLKLYLKVKGLRYGLGGILKDKKGHDLLEYALAMLLLAGAAAAGVSSVAMKINQAFTLIAAKLTAFTS